MSIGFACTACGRCCNSPPLLSLAELLRFEHVFVGCLTLRRSAPGGDAALDVLLLDGGGPQCLQLGLQGIEPPSTPRCPALQQDGHCSLHAQGKPAMCAAVPLDPMQPLAAQAIVLRRRLPGGPEDFGAQCLSSDGSLPTLVADDGSITDEAHRQALEAVRQALSDEGPLWRAPLQTRLANALPPDRLPRAGGFLSLPLTPVLELLAESGDAARARRYAKAQCELLEQRIAAALQRRRPEDRATTQEFRRWRAAYGSFLATLTSRYRVAHAG